MKEFSTTLLSCIRLADFPNQSAYAAAADVAGSTVTRALAGISFSPKLLEKLIAPFTHSQQSELVRAYVMDKLTADGVPAVVLASAFNAREILMGEETSASIRQLALDVARVATSDPAFARVLHELLAMIREHDARKNLEVIYPVTDSDDTPARLVAETLPASPLDATVSSESERRSQAKRAKNSS